MSKTTRYLAYCLILLLPSARVLAQQADQSLLKQLNEAIDSTAIYDAAHQARIDQMRHDYFANPDTSLAGRYRFYLALYRQYSIFRFDTAYYYAQQLEAIAREMHDVHLQTEAALQAAFVLLSSGMYKETDEAMNRIHIERESDSTRAAFYLLRGRYYYDLADYTSDDYFYPEYFRKAGEYLDSALGLFVPQSFDHIYYTALRQIKIGDLDRSFKNFRQLLQRSDLTLHQLALTASTLSFIYVTRNNTAEAINYQTRAALADIRSSTKETFAVLNLAQILFREGDFSKASRYIRKAVDDASFYGARQRKIQVSTILPIIQSSEIKDVKRQRTLWTIYGIAVSLLVIGFGIFLFIIRRQNRKLELAKQEITAAHARLHEANGQLTLLNAELQQANASLTDLNARLQEANKIKEEYVGYFFTLDAEFFQKIERFKKAIDEKIHYGKFNEIKYIVNSINIRDEKEELVRSFDKAFLRLFPNFVTEFNKLLEPDQQVQLAEGELLNTDLRIYALLRLGIRENEKIAEILGYSVKSIYAYKTRIRNRARGSKEDFDKKVMEIRSVE